MVCIFVVVIVASTEVWCAHMHPHTHAIQFASSSSFSQRITLMCISVCVCVYAKKYPLPSTLSCHELCIENSSIFPINEKCWKLNRIQDLCMCIGSVAWLCMHGSQAVSVTFFVSRTCFFSSSFILTLFLPL